MHAFASRTTPFDDFARAEKMEGGFCVLFASRCGGDSGSGVEKEKERREVVARRFRIADVAGCAISNSSSSSRGDEKTGGACLCVFAFPRKRRITVNCLHYFFSSTAATKRKQQRDEEEEEEEEEKEG